MSNLYWLTDAQMERLKPFFPKSHGKPRVDDRRVLSVGFGIQGDYNGRASPVGFCGSANGTASQHCRGFEYGQSPF